MTLDDRLEDYANFKVWESKQDWKDDYDRNGNIANSRKQATQAILSDLLEIIEEDEPQTPRRHVNEMVRNRLRQELREKVKKYCE